MTLYVSAMRGGDLHSALKTVVVAEVSEGGISYKHVRLQHGRDDFTDSLHARPNSYSTAGIQATDFLHFLGFSRSPCAFHIGECYSRVLPPRHDVPAIAKAIGSSLEKFKLGAHALENCGILIDQPEGWGFFYGKPGSGRTFPPSRTFGNGHIVPKSHRMNVSE